MSRTRFLGLLALVALMALPVAAGSLLTLLWTVRGEGETVYVIVTVASLPMIAGVTLTAAALALAAVIGIVRGRERRRGRRRLEDLAARHRRLFARLDHELKNPIQGIRVALADQPSDRQRRSIDAQSRRLTRLLADLRKIGEIEHTELEVTPVDPTALVQEAVAAAREQPGGQGRRLEIALPRAPRPLPMLHGDEDLLFLAVVNVLTNAVKYSGPGDRIEVRGRATEEEVVLEVADTGAGIAADELDLVWEELGRSAQVRGVEGAGLGLPLVRAVLERHGGSAGLESFLGEGTTVTLRIPRTAPRPR